MNKLIICVMLLSILSIGNVAAISPTSSLYFLEDVWFNIKANVIVPREERQQLVNEFAEKKLLDLNQSLELSNEKAYIKASDSLRKLRLENQVSAQIRNRHRLYDMSFNGDSILNETKLIQRLNTNEASQLLLQEINDTQVYVYVDSPLDQTYLVTIEAAQITNIQAVDSRVANIAVLNVEYSDLITIQESEDGLKTKMNTLRYVIKSRNYVQQRIQQYTDDPEQHRAEMRTIEVNI